MSDEPNSFGAWVSHGVSNTVTMVLTLVAVKLREMLVKPEPKSEATKSNEHAVETRNEGWTEMLDGALRQIKELRREADEAKVEAASAKEDRAILKAMFNQCEESHKKCEERDALKTEVIAKHERIIAKLCEKADIAPAPGDSLHDVLFTGDKE